MTSEFISEPEFLSDIKKLTPQHAISPYYMVKYVDKVNGFRNVLEAKRDSGGTVGKVQELLITTVFAVTYLDAPYTYIRPVDEKHKYPDTMIYGIDKEGKLVFKKPCEITMRVERSDAKNVKNVEELIINKQYNAYPEGTDIIIFWDGPAGEGLNLSKLHKRVQAYSSPHEFYLIYGATRRDIESLKVELSNLDLSQYEQDELLFLCWPINKTQKNKANRLILNDLSVHRPSISKKEYRNKPSYLTIDGNHINVSRHQIKP